MSLDVTPQNGETLRARRRERAARAIENIAITLFAEKGFQAVTVEEIAAAAEISPRTFFRYFPNKEDILVADHLRRHKLLRDAFAARPLDEPPITALKNALLYWASHYEEEEGSHLLALRESIVAENATLRAREAGYMESLMDETVIAIGLRLGVDPDKDLRPRVIVGAMLAATRAAGPIWVAREFEVSLRELVEDALRLLEPALDSVMAPST